MEHEVENEFDRGRDRGMGHRPGGLHCPIFYTASRFVWDIRDWRSAYGLVKGLSINALKEQSVFDIGNEAIALTYCHVKIAAHI